MNIQRCSDNNMVQAYTGKVAIVTGGASGMGRALCRGLAALGARVVVADINGEEAERTASEISSLGFHARAVALDVADESAVFRVVEDAAVEFGSLDFFFNNAGIGISADARDLTIPQWRKIFDVNLFGVLYGTMAAYAVMARRGSGHIVNIASLAGLAPFSINAPYTAAKYGVVGLTQALRHETSDLGVRMTLVCPGIVRTSFYDALEIIGTDHDTYMKRMPRRLISPERAAEIILKGVARNRALIIFPFHAKALWWINRLFPFVMTMINRKMVREYRTLRG